MPSPRAQLDSSQPPVDGPSRAAPAVTLMDEIRAVGMSDRAIARELGLPPKTIRRWRRGTRPRPPYLRELAALAERVRGGYREPARRPGRPPGKRKAGRKGSARGDAERRAAAASGAAEAGGAGEAAGR